MRWLVIAVLGLGIQGSAAADITVFAGRAFSTVVTTPEVSVPNVIGQASAAAADTILEAALLDLGGTMSRCSIQAAGEVIDQIPPAGTVVPAGYLVDVNVSNGAPCEGQRSRLRLNLEVKP